jgi:hypothetical protein
VATVPEDSLITREKPGLGLRHILLVPTSPRRVFARVEDTGAYGWPLVLLLGMFVLIGYAQVKTGLIDADVEKLTEQARAQLEESQADLIDRVQLRDRMEEIGKAGEFNKLISRLLVIGVSPATLLASFLLISAVFYAVVALTGRKPEYHTLMSICVYAGFIELFGYLIRLGMMLYYRTTEVDTSLAALGPPGQPSVWAAVDPFRIWFWALVAIGLVVTRQLSRRMAIASCSVMCLLALGVRVGLEYAPK